MEWGVPISQVRRNPATLRELAHGQLLLFGQPGRLRPAGFAGIRLRNVREWPVGIKA
jgi:hypothetical protein